MNKVISVTIGIPAYNEERTIGKLIDQLFEEIKLLKKVEEIVIKSVIINASGSTDNTAFIASKKLSNNLRDSPELSGDIISCKRRRGKMAALDEIFRSTKTDILVFIDADVVRIKRGSLLLLIEPFVKDSNIGATTGSSVTSLPSDSPFGLIARFLRGTHNLLNQVALKFGSPPKINGSFYALRRDLIDYFPYYIISDDEYVSFLVQRKGYKVFYVANAIVSCPDSRHLLSYIKRRARMIAGHLQVKRLFKYKVPTLNLRLIILASIYWFFNCGDRMHNRKIYYFLIFCFLEILARILSYRVLFTGKEPWKYRDITAK